LVAKIRLQSEVHDFLIL